MPNQAPKGAERKNRGGTQGLRCITAALSLEPSHPPSYPPCLLSFVGIFPLTACFQKNLLLETEIRQERDNLKSFLLSERSHWHVALPADLSVLPPAPKPPAGKQIPGAQGIQDCLWSQQLCTASNRLISSCFVVFLIFNSHFQSLFCFRSSEF